MSLPVRTTPEVEVQVREVDAWWRENRAAATDLFLDELSEAFELIANMPQLGHLYRASPIAHVRRLLLPRSRYHVYYVVRSNEVLVLAVWHARRGFGPPLRKR